MAEDSMKEQALDALKKEWHQLKKDELVSLLADAVRHIGRLEAEVAFGGEQFVYLSGNRNKLARVIGRNYKSVFGWLHSAKFEMTEVTLKVVDRSTDYRTKRTTIEYKDVKVPANALIQLEIIHKTETEDPSDEKKTSS